MSVEDTSVIDFISLDASATEVELTISDHLDWSDSERHVQLLQSKIYRYLDFIESGELHRRYPAAADKRMAIRVRAKFPPPPTASVFFDFVNAVARQNGVQIMLAMPNEQ